MMRSSKKNHGVQAVATVLAFALSILGAGIATAPAYARSCAELGHHQGISNKTAVFIAGPLKRVWLSPGGTYTVEANKTLTVKGSVSGGADTEFTNFVKAHVSASLSVSNSVGFKQGWSWTNNTRTTKWVQLGARGYEFDYSRYDVVAPCRIVNSTYKHAKMPTDEPWLYHN
ncbi:hypothetical protein [Bifidobacterium boum]|uniref:hypothetical protein n=1 Tax=Bifidobacterium boum TaxID=78343 RepID=UPI0024306721|nr:hypothetical protein [Bifidobacterium boum]MCI5861496.1 hypothetical protein [Bifidobacterium boum]